MELSLKKTNIYIYMAWWEPKTLLRDFILFLKFNIRVYWEIAVK